MADQEHEPTRYVEVAKGSARKRGSCLKLSQIPAFIGKHWKRKAIYRSTYCYTDEGFKEHLEKYGTVKGHACRYELDRLIFDIDASNLHLAKEKAEEFFEVLRAHGVPERALRIWFSGKKGFHVETSNIFGFEPSRHLPAIVQRTLRKFYDKLDFRPFQQNGLIRLPWSRHEKSGLHKVPISHEELRQYTPKQIKGEARPGEIELAGRRECFELYYEDWWAEAKKYEGQLAHLKEKAEQRPIVAKKGGLTFDPSVRVTCMSKLYRRGPQVGRRNNDIHEMARAWRSAGLPAEAAVAAAWDWVKETRHQEKITESEVRNIVMKVYRKGYLPSCDRATYEEYCDPRCIFFEDRDVAPKTVNLTDDMDEWMERYAEGSDILFNVGEVFPEISFPVQRGDFIVITGNTGIGKTALAQNLVIGLQRLKVLEIPFEMNVEQERKRYLQIAFDLKISDQGEVDELADMIKSGNLSKEETERRIGHIDIVKSPPFLEDIYELVAKKDPDLVIIDPLEDLEIEGLKHASGPRRLSTVSKNLLQIAGKLGICIVAIHHINKKGMRRLESKGELSRYGPALNLGDLKGVKAVADKASFTLGFEGKRTTTIRRVRVLKRRRHQDLYLPLKGDPHTFRFYHDDGTTSDPAQLSLSDNGASGDGVAGETESGEAPILSDDEVPS